MENNESSADIGTTSAPLHHVLEQTIATIAANLFEFESGNQSATTSATTTTDTSSNASSINSIGSELTTISTSAKASTASTIVSTLAAAVFSGSTTATTSNIVFALNATIETFRDKEYPALANFQGKVDPAYLAKINPFWLHFNPSSPRTHYIIAVIYILISSIGCFGNALVIFMFIRCKSLRTPANTLVINLAISDFIMLSKCPVAIYNSLKLGPALGDLGCKLYGFVGGLTGTVSIVTLTAIAIDRYNVVVYPLDPLRSTTKLRSRLTLAFIWIYSFMFAIIPALDIGLSIYVPEGLLTTCSFDYLDKTINARIFMFVFFIGAWFIPFVTISYCYFYILRVVSKANRIQSSKDKNKTEMKLSIIVICVIGLWFLAWTPYSIVALLGITGNEDKLTPLGSMIPAIFCKLSACIDPYIYSATHPRFRMEFGRLFFGQRYIHRTSTLRSSFPTRSSTSRRHRIAYDGETRNFSAAPRRQGTFNCNGNDLGSASRNVVDDIPMPADRKDFTEVLLPERMELNKF